MERPSFLDQEPPPGYIAGVGRGAVGFSTRGSKFQQNNNENNGRIPKRFQKSNQFSGTDSHSKSIEELQDDKDAEDIFSAIDKRLQNKNKKLKRYKQENGLKYDKMADQFSDLKRGLMKITEDEWLNLPESGDITKVNKRQRLEEQLNRKMYAAPDSLLTEMTGGKTSNVSNVNLTKLTEEREKLLGKQLDLNFQEEEGQKSEMTNQYLNELNTLQLQMQNKYDNVEEDDVAKTRLILKSYRTSDPYKSEGWISSSRLEEKTGNLELARQLIIQGCEYCARDGDIWLENIRLHSNDIAKCKQIVTQGIRYNLKNVKLWIKAMELEKLCLNQKRILRKAIIKLPHEEKLWKLMIEKEDSPGELEMIMKKSVEMVPQSLGLWISFIRSLNNFKESINWLNVARKKLPKEPFLWIVELQMEEKFNKDVTIYKLTEILQNGFNCLIENGVEWDYRYWIKQAEILKESKEYDKSVEGIVSSVVCYKPLDHSELIKYFDELGNTNIQIIGYGNILLMEPTKFQLWQKLKQVCLKLNQLELMFEIYDKIIYQEGKINESLIKTQSIIGLMYCKELIKLGKNLKASQTINEMATICPDDLQVWLAKIKTDLLNGNHDMVKETFNQLIKKFPHEARVHYKYIKFLIFKTQLDQAKIHLKEYCLMKFPGNFIFYLQLSQIYELEKDYTSSHEVLKKGNDTVKDHYSIICINYAKVNEIFLHRISIARSILDRGILKTEGQEQELIQWNKIQMEQRNGNQEQYEFLIFENLKRFPHSSLIWRERILQTLNNMNSVKRLKTSEKRMIFQDALRATNNSSLILQTIGESFFINQPQNNVNNTLPLSQNDDLSTINKAVKWFERALKSDPRNGDAWIWYTRCLLQMQATPETIKAKCLSQVAEHEPNKGTLWLQTAKDIQNPYRTPSQVLSEICRM
ncbi:hypothetical protein TBLA_0I01900 [Henningerozyma blattae CBS 6284]|uniref:PRP1 splicing factor N-terminal domain-containing protein n=1 Tax=Henningerozyma blattae (strain ATCC 34711 / CBS 6284 / DSM 70876 / NBRC 10599 / NRRL Y-10934 / UCD 77-7) TaxID=1071380 RepID=I2H8Z6_HENB6|nr:hypothetical protein TBLA_0I01900 [Tetrapisispora blattae CBS 6284]CCH62848.1 hypothetical protein TBLA_0I01900 [Tetrapisispora blattae CBS 6284]